MAVRTEEQITSFLPYYVRSIKCECTLKSSYGIDICLSGGLSINQVRIYGI